MRINFLTNHIPIIPEIKKKFNHSVYVKSLRILRKRIIMFTEFGRQQSPYSSKGIPQGGHLLKYGSEINAVFVREDV